MKQTTDEATRAEALHEANNLLQAIMVEARLVMEQPAGRDGAPLLARIVDQAHEVGRVLARLTTGSYGEPLRPTSVATLVDAALSLASPRARARGIPLVVELPPDLPRVLARPGRLAHVLVNVLVNAVQGVEARFPAGPAPLVRLRACAVPATTEGPARVRLSVWDNGVGVPEGLRALLFSTQVTTKPAGENLGFGLLVSHRIVEEHGGALWLESRPGEFTEVTVDVPAEPPG